MFYDAVMPWLKRVFDLRYIFLASVGFGLLSKMCFLLFLL